MNELEQSRAEVKELKEELAVLRQQVDWLKRQLFGRKSERGVPAGQGELGLGLEEEDAPSDPAPAKPKSAAGSRRSSRKRESRAQRLPENLPVREEIIVPLAVQAQPEAWRQMGQEVTDQLEKEPGYLYVRRLIRPKFVKIEAPHEPPVVSPAPPALIPGGFYGASLLADIILDKYLDHLPLYRIEQRFVRIHGVRLPRQTMSDNLGDIADLAAPVVAAMEKVLWAKGYVQADETPIRCLDPSRPAGSYRGWLWTAAGPPGSDVIFRWAESRGHEVFAQWLPREFSGVVQRDGYAAYTTVARQRGSQVTWAGCWAHTRRKFFEAAQAGDRQASWFVGQIALLYAVEQRARDQSLSAKLRQRDRSITSAMVLRRLKRACLRLLPRLRPKSRLGQAIRYALGQWTSLEVFLAHGQIEIDTNAVENAIRPTALGKKNWLFIGATEAGPKAAVLYSLLGSCLRRRINPRHYITWLLSRLPTATNQTVAKLTPAHFANIQAGTTGTLAPAASA